MNSHEIEDNVKRIFKNFSKTDFLFDLLLAYGISKTSITRLKNGDFNLSKGEGEVLHKKKIFFKEEETNKLLSSIDAISKEERVLKHKPRFAIVTDYKTLVAKDLKLGRNLDIPVEELPKYYSFFLPLAGSEVYHSTNDNEADRNAAYKMARLYDVLVTENKNIYNSKESIHNLNIFLSRLLFCFFAEDTEIFEEESIFTNTLAQHTADNGSDTHLFLNRLFERLNTENTKGLSAHLATFPYVNGGLFRDKIDSPVFTGKARKILVELGELNWRDINPDIFDSMIQAVIIPEYRSDLGMHYTSVPNILKLIKPLFLDELYEAFEKYQNNAAQLRKLIARIAHIKFFDPACGSGNFLIITYKELRVLEIKIIQQIIGLEKIPLFADAFTTSISLNQFYGIELDDFAHEMAILSLWLAEHQVNRVFDEQLEGYGKSKPILPLKQAGKIVQGNAARIDWKEVCPIDKDDEVYIIGNPPYFGARLQDKEQKMDMAIVFRGINGYNNLDYISCWFYKAKDYIEGLNAKVAFVTTNSICQGEQVALLWPHLISDKIEIGFAYQSFKWSNNAKGNAGVTVIILSFRNASNEAKYLFTGNIRREAKNINSYLLGYANIIITGRSKPISKVAEMSFGNMPNDGGFLLLEEDDMARLKNEKSRKLVKPFIGSSEFLKGNQRYCFWINDTEKEEAIQIPEISNSVNSVREYGLNSSREATRKLAASAHKFGEIRHQYSDAILIPRHSSENREYIPLGFYNGDTIIADSAMAIYDAQPWLFGVIHSKMHMVWVRAVGGKLKTDYRYSVKLCYNTFPFPDITLKQKENLNLYVFTILDERAKHPEKTMAQLYDPNKMPKGLRQAHEELDRAVEQCYRIQPFASDTERLEYLFKMYEEMTKKDTLFAKQKKPRKKKEAQ
ncbi:DNA methyltransferase [Agriterribacter humi]|uniref:DNA methyltransferase n=1 Tax=Agriterribacter humi TaxID=1104781 RepID=UPI0012655E31|nr:DNA methyltransferase [Agriterribacter humi]